MAKSSLRILGQGLAYAAFGVMVAYFATSPAYMHSPPEQALIKLSFSHAGARKGECRKLSASELAKLAPNMRRALDCPRERVPVYVELELDGVVLYRAELPPSGIARDGVSNAYARFSVPAGRHRLVARLRDTSRAAGFDYERADEIDLAPGQNFVVDFSASDRGFRFS